MENNLLALKGLHNKMVFRHTYLPNWKFISFNATRREMNLDQVDSEFFQTCWRDGRISENEFEPDRERVHYVGISNH